MKPAGNTTSSFASNTSRIERIAGKLLWSSFRRVKLLRDEKILISSTASFLKHTKVVCVLLQSNINLAKSNMCSLPIEYSLALSLFFLLYPASRYFLSEGAFSLQLIRQPATTTVISNIAHLPSSLFN